MSNTNLETAKAFYQTIHAGDFDGLFALLSDDCVIEYYGPASIPFAGIFEGLEKCKLFFGHVANDVDILEFRQDDFLTGDDKVAVTGHLTLRFHATGRVYDSDYAHVLTVRDDQIVRFRDFQDSAKAAHVCADLDTPRR